MRASSYSSHPNEGNTKTDDDNVTSLLLAGAKRGWGRREWRKKGYTSKITHKKKDPKPLKKKIYFFSCCSSLFIFSPAKALGEFSPIWTPADRTGRTNYPVPQLLLGMSDVSVSHERCQRDIQAHSRNYLFQTGSSLYCAATHKLFKDLCWKFPSPITTALSKTFYLIFGWAEMCSRRIKHHSPPISFWAEKQISNPIKKVTITNST